MSIEKRKTIRYTCDNCGKKSSWVKISAEKPITSIGSFITLDLEYSYNREAVFKHYCSSECVKQAVDKLYYDKPEK